MKPKITKSLALVLAGLLQILPLVRSALPTFLSAVRSPMGAIMARWAAGGVAYFGYHAISGASTLNYAISISPGTAVQGQAYSGTLTWTGGYSGEAASMSVYATNGTYLGSICLGSPYQISPGLFIQYSGGSTANIYGTPTASNSFTIGCEIYLYGGCSSNSIYEALRTSPNLTVIGSNAAPHIFINNAPQNTVAIIGQPTSLFGSANANPTATYQWQYNLASIPGATNETYNLPSVQLTNAGQYNLVASNSQGHPSPACVLSVIVPPGTNYAALNWTNYALAGVPLTMSSFITNTPSATNTYVWKYNNGQIGTNQTFSLTGAQAVPNKSGIYSIYFTSTFGTNVYANSVEYDSQWQFGWLPVITNQPPAFQNVSSGTNVTLSCTMAGGNIPYVFLYQNGTNFVAQMSNMFYNPNTASSTTNLTFTLANVTPANSGNYTFVITNFWGATTSSVSSLTVSSPLSVSSPAGHTNYVGKSVSLSVTPSGTAPFSYQWQKGGINISNGGNVLGATTNTLTFNPAATTNSGSYRVVVTNTSGSVTSSVAVVSIVAVPNVGVLLGANNTKLSASGGIFGSNYVVQVSTNLAASPAWSSLLTNTVPANGSISFTDTNAPTNGQRFYRLLFP